MPSPRVVTWAAAACVAGAGAALVVTLDRQREALDRADARIADLRTRLATQESAARRLEDEIARRDESIHVERRAEHLATEAAVVSLASRQSNEARAARDSIAVLEAQLRAVRANVDAHSLELDRARAGLDVALARRELVLPTVRVNAKSEVGSGTLVWNGTRQSKRRAYVLTAWHIVKDNAPPQQSPVEIDLYEDGHKTAELHSTVAARSEPLDLALLEVEPGNGRLPNCARLPNPRSLEHASVFSRVWAIGCPLGYAPIPTSGELTSKEKELDGTVYWMVNAPTIFGNSGGGIYLADTRELIGVLSRISAYKNLIDVAVPHMGIVTPITAVYEWLDTTDYDFIHKEALAPAVALPASQKKE